MAEFALVVVPLLVLVLAVVQVVAYLRVLDAVAAAAAEGARWAAAADRSTRDGGAVAARVLSRSADGVRCDATEQVTADAVLVVVRCAGAVPAVLPGPRLPVAATARARKEGR